MRLSKAFASELSLQGRFQMMRFCARLADNHRRYQAGIVQDLDFSWRIDRGQKRQIRVRTRPCGNVIVHALKHELLAAGGRRTGLR